MHHTLTGTVLCRSLHVVESYNTTLRAIQVCVAYQLFVCRPSPARPGSVPRCSSQQHQGSRISMDLESLPHLKHLTVAFPSGLERLDGVHTNVIGELPTLPHLTSLEIKGYNLQWKQCHQKSWQSCTRMTNLQALRLDFVHFGRDPGLHVLAALPLLTSLSINKANITFPSAQYSNLQPGLQSLKFSHCRIAGDTACMCSTLGYFTSLTSLELSNLCTPHPVQGLHQLAALTNLQTLNLGGTNTEFNEPDWLHALTSLTLLTCTQSLASASQLQSYMSRSSGSRCTVVSQPADTTNIEAQHVYVHNSEEVQYSSYFYEDEGYSKGACTDSWQGQHTVDAMQRDKLWMAALLHNCWLDTCNSRGTDYDSHISDNQDHRSDTEDDFSTDDE